jgi:integrase
MLRHPLLTQLAVDRAKARGRRYELPDGPGGVPGFGVRVGEHGAKTFVIRYRVGGRQRRLKIGSAAIMTLLEARQRARIALAQVEQDLDPAAARLEERRERERNSVAAVAAEYVAKHLKRNTRRWRDAEQMLARDVLPALGDRPLASITRRDVLDVVDAVVDRGSPVSANRVLSLVKRLLGWAVQRGIVQLNVAAGLKPPHREKPRERALSEAEVRAVWQAFEAMGWPFGSFGELLLLTGQRRGEVAGMRWADLDLERGVWRLPGESNKTGREYLLPLSLAAVEILRALPRIGDGPLVFPSTRAASANPVSGFSRALRAASRLSGVEGWHWHDLRRTCATGMARLNVPPHVVERILNHGGGSTMSVIARTYNTHSYQSEMRQALEAWAREVERIVSGAESRVLPLRTAAG